MNGLQCPYSVSLTPWFNPNGPWWFTHLNKRPRGSVNCLSIPSVNDEPCESSCAQLSPFSIWPLWCTVNYTVMQCNLHYVTRQLAFLLSKNKNFRATKKIFDKKRNSSLYQKVAHHHFWLGWWQANKIKRRTSSQVLQGWLHCAWRGPYGGLTQD